MQANYVQRIRLTFSKFGPARFISHLDLARALERSLNRADIPVAYSQGYNRRPRLQFASALPLGVTSRCELVDVWLARQMLPATVQSQLAAKIAPGIAISDAKEVPLAEAALQGRTVAATYVATLLEPPPLSQLQRRIETLLLSESFPLERTRGNKTKRFDLRAVINELKLAVPEGDQVDLHLNLSLSSEKTGRPDDVLFALGLDPLNARVCRTRILLRTAKNELAAAQT